MAAISLGGYGMKWAPQANTIGKWFTGNYGKRIAGAAGRNTLGRLGKGLGKDFDSMAARAQENKYGRAATSVLRALKISQGVRGGLKSVEKGKYGSDYNLGDVDKEDKERKKEVAKIGRENKQEAAVYAVIGKNGSTDAGVLTDFNSTVKKMNKKELSGYSFKDLSHEKFLKAMSSKQFDELIENNEAEMNDDEKQQLKDLRKKTIEEELQSGFVDPTKELLKRVSGKELAGLDNKSVLTTQAVMNNLTIKQLQEIGTELNDRTIKQTIKRHISNVPETQGHPARGWMRTNGNKNEWA
jgi:hypothetical protein